MKKSNKDFLRNHQFSSGLNVWQTTMLFVFLRRVMSEETVHLIRDLEELSVMFGVKRFHLCIFGRHFEILAAHKPPRSERKGSIMSAP